MTQRVIYLDNLATTRVDPRALNAMLPYFSEEFGNAASRNHAFGWAAEKAVESAREHVATLINANAKEIVFTSGATESDNLAIKGAAYMLRDKGRHIVTSPIEHKAVIDTVKHLEQEGFEVQYLDPGKDGWISPESVAAAIRPGTILVSLMAANNEVGTLNDLAAIGRICKERSVWFHTDAAQACGKIPIDVEAMGIDLMSISAHKMYAPKGVGALYVRRKNPRVRLVPLMDGGGHERGMRSGTLNVPAIVGFGEAARIARAEMDEDAARILRLRERLHDKLRDGLDFIHLNGHPNRRLPGVLNVSFAYVEGEALMMGMSDVAVSSGSACTSASLEPSYVLRALGVGDDLAHCSIRFGIGRFNTEQEIDHAAQRTIDAVRRLREMSPLYEMAKEGIRLEDVRWTPASH